MTVIGETNQTGAITVASSSQSLTLNLGTGTGAATVNIATGATAAKTVNIATSASLLHFINIGSASTTVNLPGKVGIGTSSPSTTLHIAGDIWSNGNIDIASSTSALNINIGAGTGGHAVKIATGQASSTITIGSSSSTIVVNNFWTSFPTSPVDGQEIIYAADSGNGVFWHFKYYASTTKWVFTGGPPLYSEVTTGESPGSTGSYVALTTAGPSITLPFAGDYDVEIGVDVSVGGSAGNHFMSYDIGGTGAVDGDAVVITDAGSGGQRQNNSRLHRKTGLGAVTLTAKYKAPGTSVTFRDRWMAVWPVQK